MPLLDKPTRPAAIPAVPTPAPQRNDRVNFLPRAEATLGWMPDGFDATNENISYVHDMGDFVEQEAELSMQALAAAEDQVDLCRDQVGLAVVMADYKGLWVNLSGALAMPASVSHGGLFWALNASLANVAAEEPGNSDKWMKVPGVTEIGTPTNMTPAAGATNVGATAAIVLQANAFASIYVSDTHSQSQWQINTAPSFMTPAYDSGAVSGSTSFTVPETVTLATGTQHWWRVRYKSSRGTWSAWSRATAFVTAAAYGQYIPNPVATPAIGAAFLGGYYCGMTWNEIARATEAKTIATGAATVITLDAASSMYLTPLVYVGQQLEVRSRANPANKFVGTVVSANRRALTLNVTSVGGAGTFADWSVMSRFRKILAPKASGQANDLAYKNTQTAAPTECITTNEGLRATLAMCAAGDATAYPAAWFCRNLNIGGYNDWFFPSRDEMELVSRNLNPRAGTIGTASRVNASTRTYTVSGAYGDATTGQCEDLNSSPQSLGYATGGIPALTAATAFQPGGSEVMNTGAGVIYYINSTEFSDTACWCQNYNTSSTVFTHQGSIAKTITGGNVVRAMRQSII